MLVAMRMNDDPADPIGHFELNGVFEKSNFKACKVYCIIKVIILHHQMTPQTAH
jgi:hypothetical protein